MRLAHIATITRREVRDTLGDWRILLPVVLLALLLPQLMAGAMSQMQRFLDDQQLVGRIVPFVVLIVGFIPSSFSLITALETFVGERERNSLEALLAMPIKDKDLYLGKLFSALIVPLVSSLIAMAIFASILLAFKPGLYFAEMTVVRLAQLVLMIILMALTMVSASVVISSHISSIRAANLMSSFILLPMAGIVQWAAFMIINNRWEMMWLMTGVLAVCATILVRMGLVTFNREVILSREGERMLIRPASKTKQDEPLHYRAGNPLLTIARRELGETLTDWRVLIPVSILAFGIPGGLVASGDFAISFVANAELVGRIIPFAALLVAFIPASFSLIAALESFVGERERNSLESLLAMPLSDTALYASKLCSSLVIPLISSWGSLLAFLGLTNIFFPQLYNVVMSPGLIALLLAMISAVTVMMVAGAVVISSHTGSIRAATLLASFVLIPTAVILQLQVLLIIARRWDVMWIVTLGLVVVVIALIRTGMASFNREEILSREHEQFSLQRLVATFWTFFYEYQPAGVVPDKYPGTGFSTARFYRSELPALLRDLRIPIGVALFGAVTGCLVGGFIGTNYRVTMFDEMLANIGVAPHPSFGLGIEIFANNLRVSIFSNLFAALSFGAVAFLVPTVAFTQIGFVTSVLAGHGGSWTSLGIDSPLQFLLAYVLPHGIVELPTFILSAAIGLRIGASLLSPPKGFSVAQNMLWAIANFLKLWLLILLPLIFIAAIIEGSLTPLIIGALY